MPLAGITDREVLSTVCFVVIDVSGIYIGICVRHYKTDSMEKFPDKLITPSCSILRSGFRETVSFLSLQSVIVDIEINCCNSSNYT